MILPFVARRLVLLIPVVLGVTLLVFLAMRFAPGDPLKLKMGDYYQKEDAAAIERQYRLDRSLPVQYLLWLRDMAMGDLGRSIFTNEPVTRMLANRAPLTLMLAIGTMSVALLISIPLGVLSAVYKDTWFDNISRVLSVLGISMPVYWIGLILIILFALRFPIFPPGGTVEQHGLKAIVLPSIALGSGFAALITRMMRSTMLEVLSEDYLRTARAKGLSELAVINRHALKNALIPVVTVIGFQFGTILGGAVLTEVIFNLPGLGRLLVDSVARRDYPVIQGGVLLVAFVFVLTNLLVDVLYVAIDPRIRYE